MDSILEFEGERAPLFAEYVRFKRALGYSYGRAYQNDLRDISRVVARRPDPEVVGKAAAEELTARRESEKASNHAKRVTILRQFCVWLESLGYSPATPPPVLVRPSSEFVPHIVTEREMAGAIALADETRPAWICVLLRMLWCCGLRVGEAVALEVGDVDLEGGTILVRRAKGDRTRLVPMSPSLAVDVAVYVRGGHCGSDPCSPLFPSPRGGGFRHESGVRYRLAGVFGEAGLLAADGRPIRTHDLRHSFAVATLDKALASGDDAYSVLPVLAEYMGHSDIRSTEYYLRLTEDAMAGVVVAQEATSEAVFGGGRA